MSSLWPRGPVQRDYRGKLSEKGLWVILHHDDGEIHKYAMPVETEARFTREIDALRDANYLNSCKVFRKHQPFLVVRTDTPAVDKGRGT